MHIAKRHDASFKRDLLARQPTRVIAQTSALLVEDVIERTRHAKECGAEGVMVLPPFFEGPTDDQGIYDFYAAVSEAGLPIIGYNVPQGYP
ncbi:dihydrodipicolinate synthase family protein [Pseudomonas sichuanensis]|uniref:dihydrodipicolinate synthase family protein n=1 Tax=Pseudomonas sichuanensis TaxID=2213015 RepID=UPI002446ABC3|nr:dihydrodipicolinate synthase family protein [Pseudomonas sichuanensis]MDH0731313.1 dihydrodipicolinate synthase family protein [Pseudomonas sichuanensis]MDH1583504.1 dihydrodipicolinate synthase family protein [Pseudomonas sichuanensis]MDH1592758.1 dihydrodipicolinate synthase family protein [Pseudomonas sichuanensis]MDH1598653.1 dihydrodipicolinate synthase family protein [Pseudomonas sichuanensis]